MTSTLIKRNVKLFFRDKGMFFTSLITPFILLVLYTTFLGNVYRDSFMITIPEGITVSNKLIDSLVASQLVSSILAVSCVTIAFCANFLMVQDKSNGVIKDLRISPVKQNTLSISYYIASIISTLIICFTATVICLCYLGFVGFYMSATDVILLFIDVLLLVLFGIALSSIINSFLSTQGQISAVGSIVSSVYGFICGAYMPISSFNDGLQKAIVFLPGAHGTSLLRNHAMNGVINEMQRQGLPSEAADGFKNALDCNLYFFGNRIEISEMYIVLGTSVIFLVAVYILINILKKKKI